MRNNNIRFYIKETAIQQLEREMRSAGTYSAIYKAIEIGNEEGYDENTEEGAEAILEIHGELENIDTLRIKG